MNPNGAETKYHFDYGTTTEYGKKTAEVSAGSGTSNLEESTTISRLTKSTSYHFRIVATNSNGTTTGADQVFATTNEAQSNCPKQAGSKKWTLCVEGIKTNEESFKTTLKGESAQFTSVGQSWRIRCPTASGTGIFGPEGTERITARRYMVGLRQCKVEEPPSKVEKCQIQGREHEIRFGEGGEPTGRFGPSAGGVSFSALNDHWGLLNIVLKEEPGENETCLWSSNKDELRGGPQECTLGEVEAEALSHILKCEGEKSHITRYTREFPFSIESTVELSGVSNKKKFSIIEGT